MLEWKFTYEFEKLCKRQLNGKINFVHREYATNPKNPHMDIEISTDAEYIRLEAKVLTGDIRSQSQRALSLFGSLLKGRKLPPAQDMNLPIIYGVLIPAENVADFKKIWSKSITVEDWNNFGEIFTVRYVVTASDQGKISFIDWTNFLV